MYRHGFGDCFLLRFFSGKTLKFKMLIDCGLKHNDSVKEVPLADVVKDIIKEVSIKKDGKSVPHLDVLVITHEHWDHVSAFKPERKLFDQFDVDKIWMAWTENPKDEEAKIINAHLKKSITALAFAANKISSNTEKKEKAGFFKNVYKGNEMLTVRKDYQFALNSVTEFYGPLNIAKNVKTSPSGIQFKKNFKISIETQKALDHVKSKLAKNKSGIEYFLPGKLMEKLDGLPGIRIYVLGPPKNEKLNKDTPSAGKNKEVYFGETNTSMMGFVRGILKMAGADQGFDDGNPFTNVQNIKKVDAEKHPYYKGTYFKSDEAWRTIEDDWLDITGALALQMDNDTNNTSLALAIEMIDQEKILLFPGDAQVGNWLSWHDHTWKVTKNGKTESVNAENILNKTVFYKAGHHASHNATLKTKGLEMMNHPDLVTFVPEKEDQYNGIPFEPLLTRLDERCKGRVLVSADKNFKAETRLKNKPAGLSAKEWKHFKDNIEINQLFIEYTIIG